MSTFQRGTKDIENASGLVVREDMQDTIKAVAAHNYGPLSSGGTLLPTEFIAEDSGTPKKLFIRGTSGGNLAQRGVPGQSATLYEVGNLDEDNLGLVKRSGDTFSGPLLLSNSNSSTSPALSFNGDTDTGLYRPGENTIAFSTGGTTRASVGSYGIEITFGGNLELKNAGQTYFTALTANDSISESRTYILPQTKVDGGFLKVASSSGGISTLAWEAVASVPVAAVFCMATSDVPDGYLECNGEGISGSGSVQGVNKNLLGNLRDKIGNSLPDLRGEFVRGWASNTTDSTRDQGRSIRGTQSSDIVSHDHGATSTATVTDPSHHHSPTTGTSNNSTAEGSTLAVNDRVVGNYGSGDGQGLGPLGTRQFMNNTQCGISVGVATTVNAHGGSETRPRNVALMYIIKY